MSKKGHQDQPKISDPKVNSGQLPEEELATYVKDVLEPMVNKFEKDHKGKEISYSDIEKLYTDLSNNLSKNPTIQDKYLNNNEILSHMARTTSDMIIDDKNSISDKLLHGFGDLCKKIGLGKIGTACIQHVEKNNLRNQLDRITKDVTSIKKSKQVIQSKSAEKAKPIANPKIGGQGR